MRKTLPLVCTTVLLAGCGGQIDLTCDKPALYQEARESQRVVAPEGFDQLDLSREMPVPSAAPAKPRPAGQPCLDIPPRYLDELRKQQEEDNKAEAEQDDG